MTFVATVRGFLRRWLSDRWRSTDTRSREVPAANPGPKRIVGEYLSYGYALTTWAMFERSVDIALWNAIAGKIEVAACVTEQMQSIRSKLLVFENIAEHRGATKQQIKELRQFRNSLEGITRERNRLIHDPHHPDGADMIATRIVLKSDDKFVEERLTASQLFEFAERVGSKTAEWYNLYPSILIAIGIGPSSGKFP